MRFKNKIEHLKKEISDLLKEKGVDATEKEMEFINDAIETIDNDYNSEVQRLEDEINELEAIAITDDDDDDYVFYDVEANDPIRLVIPDNTVDKQITDAFVLCLKSGKLLSLLDHLESFAKSNNTINLIP